MALRRRRRKHRRPKVKRLPRWAVLLLGLSIGILFVLLTQYLINRVGSADSGLSMLFSRLPAASNRDGRTYAKTPAKPAKPKFDFYTILPGIETILPEKELREGKHNKPRLDPNLNYVLQAASFANFNDADRLKAMLALNGLVAHIEKVTIENKGKYFRVRLGPYDRVQDLDATDKKLSRLGIKALRLQVKQSP